jgi:hypothetical protein
LNLLDEGVGDTFGSVSATSAVHTSIFHQRFQQHANLLAAIGIGSKSG